MNGMFRVSRNLVINSEQEGGSQNMKIGAMKFKSNSTLNSTKSYNYDDLAQVSVSWFDSRIPSEFCRVV